MDPSKPGAAAGGGRLAYPRLILGFCGVVMLAAGTALLARHALAGAAPGPGGEAGAPALLLLAANAAALAFLAWKVAGSLRRRAGGRRPAPPSE